MDIKSGRGMQSLLEMLSGRSSDPEHDAIIDSISKLTADAMNEMSQGNPLARLYVQDLWHKCISSLTDIKDFRPDEPVTIAILRLIAEAFEKKNALEKELFDRRKAEKEKEKVSEHH